MPYNGSRVDSASRAFSPDEGRGAYAKWHLRSSASRKYNETFGQQTTQASGKFPRERQQLGIHLTAGFKSEGR
jgi:hypothetical protein